VGGSCVKISVGRKLVRKRGCMDALGPDRTEGSVPFSERLRAASKAYGDRPEGLLDALIDGCDGGPD
jgi:hypothetical protein